MGEPWCWPPEVIDNLTLNRLSMLMGDGDRGPGPGDPPRLTEGEVQSLGGPAVVLRAVREVRAGDRWGLLSDAEVYREAARLIRIRK